MAEKIYKRDGMGGVKEQALEDVSVIGPGEALDEAVAIGEALNAMGAFIPANVMGAVLVEFGHWLYSKRGEHFKVSTELMKAARENTDKENNEDDFTRDQKGSGHLDA